MTDRLEHLRARNAANPFDPENAAALAYALFDAGDYVDACEVALTAEQLGGGEFGEMALLAARCATRTDETEAAVTLLMHALDRQLRNLAALRTDPDFADARADPLLRQVLGIPDTPLDRDAGWRFDLDFFVQEVKRRSPEPFAVITSEQYHSAVEWLQDAIPTMSDARILLELDRLLVPLRDGHAYVCPALDRTDLLNALPLGFYDFLDDGIFVTHGAPDYADLVGKRALAIDGKPIDAVAEAVANTICRDNDIWLKEIAPFRLREPALLHALGLVAAPDRVVLTVQEEDGAARERIVPATGDFPTAPLGRNFPFPTGWVSALDHLGSAPLYLRDLRTPFWFEPLPEMEAVYLQINQVRDAPDETLAAFSERFFQMLDDMEPRHLILDLRMNKGGNTTLEWPFIHRLIAHPVNQCGRLFVIIGRRTFSAALNFAAYLELHTNAIFVGEPTGSSPSNIGESIEFDLPWSKTRVNIADLRWQSGWPWDRRPWIPPDLYTPPTWEAYRTGRDVALDAIAAEIAHPTIQGNQ